MAELINVGLQKNIRTKLKEFIVADLVNINLKLNAYTDYPGGVPILTADSVFRGRRASRNLRSFPAVTINSDNKTIDWISSKTTDEIVSCSIFCCVAYTETEYTDDVLEDLAEAINAVLIKSTKFDFTVIETIDNVETPVTYGIYDSKITNISWGFLDQGFLKAAELTWSGSMYITQSQAYL